MSTLPIVFTGHVDHGKSTLVARLLLDTGFFPDGKIAELEAASQRRGVPFELSFLLDAFQVERDQAITIDATRIWFRSDTRRYEIIDAPGHREFVRHMVSGAADALAAVVVIDAGEGIGEQTRRHALLLPLVGVTRAIVVVNKMDTIGFDGDRFANIERQARALFAAAGLELVTAIPAVARDGDNVVTPSARMPWYPGRPLLGELDALAAAPPRDDTLCFPVQDVYRRDEERIHVGTLRAGRIEAGMTLRFAPSRETARVKEIVRFPASDAPIRAGESAAFTLDRPIFVDPGDVAGHVDAVPAVADAFTATIFWLDAQPIAAGEVLRMRCGTRDVSVALDRITSSIDVGTFEQRAADAIARNDVGEVTFRALSPAVLDPSSPALGRFALYRGVAICGGGIVRTVSAQAVPERKSSTNVTRSSGAVGRTDRMRRSGHQGLVVWLTGLPSSGKSTLAYALEAKLFAAGWNAFVLDGDTLRTGLNGDLGFSLADRMENVRRTGEVAALFAEAGLIAIVSLVSPLAADRARARAAAAERFHEVYIKASVAACEVRDVKGLYRRARAGEIADFTGVGSPYEEPAAPELLLDTETLSVDDALAQLVDYVRRTGRLTTE